MFEAGIVDPTKVARSALQNAASVAGLLLTTEAIITDKPEDVIAEIRKHGKAVGVSLNPTTEIDAIAPILEQVDLVLVMSVWPGFGGQSFMPEVLDKVRRIRTMLGDGNSSLLRIPPGVAHGCRNLATSPARIIYFTDRHFSSEPDECDEGRLPWDFCGKEVWDVTIE